MPLGPIEDAELSSLFAGLLRFQHLGLAVSGGPDSTALMQLIVRWRRLTSNQDPNLTVLTVDHGLRTGSAAEAEAVRAAAAKLGLRHETLIWEGPKPETAIQARARAARYGLMATAADRLGLDAVVTGHTADDQAETMLMRLARGSGLDGLSGMAAETRIAGLLVLRPLLGTQKSRLLATLARDGIPTIDDPSNQNSAFERVRTRGAWPALNAAGITQGAFALSAKRLLRARLALKSLATDWLTAHAVFQPAGFATIPLPEFGKLPEELAIRVLQRVINAVGGAPEPAALAEIEELAARCAVETFAGATLGQTRIIRKQHSLLAVREIGRNPPADLSIAAGKSTIWDNRFRIGSLPATASVLVRWPGDEVLKRLLQDLKSAPAIPTLALASLPSFFLNGSLAGVAEPLWRADFGRFAARFGRELQFLPLFPGKLECLLTE